MAFVLGKKRIHKFRLDPVGITLSLREFTPDERSEFEKGFRLAVNAPTSKKDDLTYDDVLCKAAKTLLVEWDGIVGADEKPLPLTDETKAQFFDDVETAKFWRPAVRGYLFPTATAAE